MFIKFFYLSKTDRIVIFFLLAVICILVFLMYFFSDRMYTMKASSEADSLSSASVSRDTRSVSKGGYYQIGEARRAERFVFDPNTADSAQLLRLGLQPWQVRSIYKYRSKGGIYRRPEDFARLYGLTKKQYMELRPYIHISSDYEPAASMIPQETYEPTYAHKPYKEYDRDTVRFPIKIKAGEHVNVALADTSMLKKVPGIGSGWARAIVSYRERLGGFYAVGQLLEIDNFPHEALPFFVAKNGIMRKMNVNKLSLNELRRHPYINFYQARDICDYRRLHGPLKSLQQLRLLKDFPPEAIARLEPYVEF